MGETLNQGGLTVVLPAFQERENIGPLLDELFEADAGRLIKRVIIVDDDSKDGTADFIKAGRFQRDVLCLQRIGRKGLSSAVTEGILLADSDFIAVMDADGQHRPADLMGMAALQAASGASIIVGSRFLERQEQESHAGLRHRFSEFGNALARFAAGSGISDPLTGFFLMERRLFVQLARKIRPDGFKILLEILHALRGSDYSLREYQIEFRKRMAGESKLDAAVVLEFAEQIANRASGGLIPQRFLGFALVGSSGVAVHFAVLSALLFLLAAPFTLAQTLATLTAIVWNFTLNNLLTFRRNRRRGLRWLSGLGIFALACGAGALANIGVASVMNSGHYVWWLSGLAGVVVGTVFNFVVSRDLVWKD